MALATRPVKRLFMEEFVGPSIHKGPGIYQRQCVLRIIPQAELATLMCEYEQGTSIFQESQRAESIPL